MRSNIDESTLQEIETCCIRLAELFPEQPCLSFGVKTSRPNAWGGVEEILWVAETDRHTGQIPQADGWTALYLDPLRSLVHAENLRPADLAEILACSRATSTSPQAPFGALLHAAIPHPYTCFSQPPALLAAFCQPGAEQRITEWYADPEMILSFTPDLPSLCVQAGSVSSEKAGQVLLNRGLISGSETLEDCLDQHSRLAQIAADWMTAVPPEPVQASVLLDPFETLPLLRLELSTQAGKPLVLHRIADSATLADLQDPDCLQALLSGSALPELVSRSRPPAAPGHPVEGASTPACPAWDDPAPRVFLQPGLGLVAAGESAGTARTAAASFHLQMEAVLAAHRTGGYLPLPIEDLNAALQWELKTAGEKPPFAGEVALVTGAASGIGKACAASLLLRGSAVVSLDINPAVCDTFHHPAYLGLVCDITNEDAVRSCFHETALRFGGLDMLVLNAGLFPGGCPISSLSLAEFTRVMNCNLNANLVLLREAYPLLKAAPRYGRVVIVGSKNMRAPGPGASAYSSSKAALTQLARVAALEWGPDRIRVNVVHPDAVFDTALYTEEVLKARAAHYDMTVEQYKKRNLLKAEITSHDIGEMVAEMCGPLFRVITGAQVQMDGGNDRTI